MGFTPAANVTHGMTLKVGKERSGLVRFEAIVTNGSDPRQTYVKEFVFDSDLVGPLNRIGRG